AAMAMVHIARKSAATPGHYGGPVLRQSATPYRLREGLDDPDGAQHLLQLRQAEERLFRLAGLDPLTELADREAFSDALASHSGSEARFSLVLLDIDGFRQLSASLDQHDIDTVLKILANRLRVLFRNGLVVARLGGDEFAVLLSETSPDVLRRVCRLALQALADPIA